MKHRIHVTTGAAWLCAALLLGTAASAQPAPTEAATPQAEPIEAAGPLVVATREAPPFARRDAAGNWEGLSIDLWQDVADKLGLLYEWRELPLGETLDALETGEVDVAVVALTVTEERERSFDFSYPYLQSGLTLAVDPGRSGWLATARAFFSGEFAAAVSALVLVLLLAGVAMWLLERRANPEHFGGGAASGLWSSFWWSAVTMTTVGYGDKAPITVGGRIVALVWMFTSVIVIASFTASIAASVTVNQLQSDLFDEDRLARTQIAVLADSRPASLAEERGLRAQSFPSLDAAADALAAGEVEAILHDAPILTHLARTRHDGKLEVLSGSLARDDYGFAFPSKAPLRERVNVALLSILHEPVWKQIRTRYLGADES